MYFLGQHKNRPLGLVDIKSTTPLPPHNVEALLAEPIYKQPSHVEMNISLTEKVVEPPSREAKHKKYKLREKKQLTSVIPIMKWDTLPRN